MKEYTEIINYIETSQPDIVAEYIRKLLKENDRIAELEREVEKLEKEKALDNSFWKQECDSLQADLKSQKLLTEIYMAISGTRAEKKDYEKVIRHEICEKIRLYCRDKFEPVFNKLGCIAEINREEFFEFIDKIEQAKEMENEEHTDKH